MRLATFKVKGEKNPTVGAFSDGRYIDLYTLSNRKLPRNMLDFLRKGKSAINRAHKLADEVSGELSGSSEESLKLKGKRYVYREDEVELLAPVPSPGKIIHTACNFDAHLDELTTWKDPEWESHNWKDFHFEHPTGFLQAPSSVCGQNAEVEIPVFTQQLDYEIEIAIIIGREAVQVGVDDAMDYVAGYTIFNDLSARDIQGREHSNKVILMGKSFINSCPLGPHLVTPDQLSDPHKLDMKLVVNGEVRQDSSTANMHYKTAELVSWWSLMGLYPGDIITSGSPPGVIAGMDEPVWLKPGDVIEANVAELGKLTTRVV